MSISIASNNREWVEACNEETTVNPIAVTEVEYYYTDTDYGLGVSIWEIDGTRILVAQNMLFALDKAVGTHGLPLGDYVDLYLSGIEQIHEVLYENGYGDLVDSRWLTDELAAPPIPIKES